MAKDYYEILQVHPNADVEVIKNAYRTLLKGLKMHPDLGGSTAQAQQINEAYETLSDTDRRARYDRQRAQASVRSLVPAPARPSRGEIAAAKTSRARALRWFKWLGWAVVAAGASYSGRELLTVSRLSERSSPSRFGGFFSMVPASPLETRPALVDRVLGAASTSTATAPSGPGTLVKTGRAGPARAGLGGAVLLDQKHRWEISPPPPAAKDAATPANAAPPRASRAAAPAPSIDLASLSRRKENALRVLRWMGALAVLLLVW